MPLLMFQLGRACHPARPGNGGPATGRQKAACRQGGPERIRAVLYRQGEKIFFQRNEREYMTCKYTGGMGFVHAFRARYPGLFRISGLFRLRINEAFRPRCQTPDHVILTVGLAIV